MDESFHYPPELLQLLVDTIPKLCKSKEDLLVFFEGAGVPRMLLQPYAQLLRDDRDSFSKYPVARELVVKLNQQGDSALRARRELVKRVTEFDDFGVCWPNDQVPARGLVAQVREVVNVKDSFTRMRLEKDEERRKRLEQQTAAANARQAETARRARAKDNLFSLFGEKDAQKRGKQLEAVLNELFGSHGILVSQAFTVTGARGEGIIEQIDGLIEFEGHPYLVEMKWWGSPIGAGEMAQHLVRLFGRGGQARGLFISYSDYTAPAVTQCREAISRGAVVVLSTLAEIVSLLNEEGDMKDWLRAKVRAAIVDKEPLARR